MATSHKRAKLPLYFRRKAQGSTASGHKLGRRWSQRGVAKRAV